MKRILAAQLLGVSVLAVLYGAFCLAVAHITDVISDFENMEPI